MKKIIKEKDLSMRLNLGDKIKKSAVSPKAEMAAGGGVLNKKVMEAAGRAEAIIKEANVDSEKIRKEAAVLLSQVNGELVKAREKGFKQGRDEGFAKATQMIVSSEKKKEEFYKNAEENIIKLVMMIAEKVIGKIAHENSEAIKSIVRQAIEKSLGDKIVVKLNPEDYKAVLGAEAEMKASVDRTKRVVFREDENITRGGCVVETEVGTIDAQLETQLSAIKKALEL